MAEPTLRIGFVNNMPDGAFVLAERQFQRLIDASLPAGSAETVRFVLTGFPRGELCRAEIGRRYLPINRLTEFALDALIVTGAEPFAADLRREAFWADLVAVIDHASRTEIPAVFSCLAAHAAVLHLSGIARIRLEQKCFGIFECAPDVSHPLMAGAGTKFMTPHSRWNGLDAETLRAHGYQVASHSGPEIDTFTRVGSWPVLFLQGHPEYEPRTLLLEYQRDISRFASGERQAWPVMPRNSFDEATQSGLQTIEAQLASLSRIEAAQLGLTVLKSCEPAYGWQDDARLLFRNWFASVATSRPCSVRAERHAG